ncbi:MAG: dockerin type I domain-containing protein [Bacillota bacterium]
MFRKSYVLLIVLAFLINVLITGNVSRNVHAENPSPVESNQVYLFKVPENLSRQDVINADENLKEYLSKLATEEINTRLEASDSSAFTDFVVVYVDKEGNPILPEYESSKSTYASFSTSQVPNELTFTFDSSDYPWTLEELEILKSEVNNFYPVIKQVYGNPAFSNTVNIKKNPNLSYVGMYDSYNNTITLRSISRLETLCHEIIHSFRDDYVVSISAFEEGMTRAAQIEVFSRMDKIYPNIDRNHSYTYDVYYEALNRHKLGGDVWSGYVSALLFYQLCGYAWGKAVIEDPNFFVNFNKELYDRCKTDISSRSSVSALLDIAESVKPTVESIPFKTWYKSQSCFNLQPPEGTYIYQRINQFTIDCFKRTTTGNVLMQPNININWYIYDCSDNLLNSGSSVTSSYGWASMENYPIVPISYKGRIKVVAETSDFTEVVRDISLRSSGNEAGVFGILPNSTSGKITFIPFDTKYPTAVADVTNGAFSVPALETVKGTIKAVFESEQGDTFIKIFTKDASKYFLMMAPSAPCDIMAETQSRKVMLSWNGVENAHYYNVKRCIRIDGEYTTVAESVYGTTYVDEVSSGSSIYYYTITSVSAGNEGLESKPIKVTVPIEPSPLPTITASPTIVPTEVPIPTVSPKINYGDVNGDGSVNSTDYTYVKRYILKIISDFPSPQGKLAADVDGSGQINSTDLVYIKRYILGTIDIFPAQYKLF